MVKSDRGDRIRTCDIQLPKLALYQAELRPVGKSFPRAIWAQKKWLGTGSNRRHADFQSAALPTELPSHSASPLGAGCAASIHQFREHCKHKFIFFSFFIAFWEVTSYCCLIFKGCEGYGAVHSMRHSGTQLGKNRCFRSCDWELLRRGWRHSARQWCRFPSPR